MKLVYQRKPFRCLTCGQKFVSNGTLYNHMVLKHKWVKK